MLVIGLTGNIGSGKSLAAAYLSEAGAYVVDADQVAHEVIAPGGTAYAALLAAFGSGFADENGYINRKALGSHVFADESGALARQLNDITHPPIRQEIKNRLLAAEEAGYHTAVVEAALLLQSELLPLMDEIWLISAPEEMLIRRARERDKCDEATVRRRLARQLSQEEMAARCSRVFENDSNPEKLRSALLAAYAKVAGR